MGCNLLVKGDKSPQINKFPEKISRGLVTKPLLGRFVRRLSGFVRVFARGALEGDRILLSKRENLP